MVHFDLPKQKSSIVKVIGVGGGGSNAVNYMFAQGDTEGVDFVICNTDSKALAISSVPNKVQLGPQLTQGLGAGADPEKGKLATEESLDEIKKILEVNTKMAFITVGMGGGTGTGGAPIVAKACKDLGILTVGIVTTPFAFEGPRRMDQAEQGIRALRPHVDTLLVISNDKLRVQYGNLKMKEAFGKADNVLATAAKCITDIIQSHGHIIVDFADVCTVMRNGGVAILGKAEVEGETRAYTAIEEALNSPLLNDNDIKGAKWILINIKSGEEEYECTMDELETISSYVRAQAGADTDVIIGEGADNTLGAKLSITIIATGFPSKDIFGLSQGISKINTVANANEKIVMTLQEQGVPKKEATLLQQSTEKILPIIDPFAPILVAGNDSLPNDNCFEAQANNNFSAAQITEPENPVIYELSPNYAVGDKPLQSGVDKMPMEQENAIDIRLSETAATANLQEQKGISYLEFLRADEEPTQTIVATKTVAPSVAEAHTATPQTAENTTTQWQGLLAQYGHEDIELAHEKHFLAKERLQNFRVKINSNDPNSELEHIPAYIRQNAKLKKPPLAPINLFSKHKVEENEEGVTILSRPNQFLEGKKPD